MRPTTLVYKRTHNGDPDGSGCFGCNGCMGSVRSWPFDAVIGVGGVGRQAKDEEIAHKLTWIGIGPHRRHIAAWPDPVVYFDHYLYLGTEGPELRTIAPLLAELMYVRGCRTVMTFTDEEQEEVDRLLVLAESEPPSLGLTRRKRKMLRRCRSRRSTHC